MCDSEGLWAEREVLDVKALAKEVFGRADRDAVLRSIGPALAALLLSRGVITKEELIEAIRDWQ